MAGKNRSNKSNGKKAKTSEDGQMSGVGSTSNDLGHSKKDNSNSIQPTATETTTTTKTITTTTIVKNNQHHQYNNHNGNIHLLDIVFYALTILILFYSLMSAYMIRLYAIKEYGTVIHEFDPYFNYRATEYLYNHGRAKFFTWFDHKSWYPLGRPVGTTIYPGMQFTAVFIKNHIMPNMSLNDICCYIPAWFGVIATILVGLITYECSLECNTNTHIIAILWNIFAPTEYQLRARKPSKNDNSKNLKWKIAFASSVCSMYIMAIVPAHMMRSVGGGYDNECIAISAMLLTFYFWVRSLRNGEKYSYLFGILAGLAYFYMVATWGGYVFVLNMIGLHATLLVGMGRFTTKAYLSYTLFYIVGTSLAIQIPVVGWTPLKSLEQLGCLAIFIGYQVLFISEKMIQKRNLSKLGAWKLRITFYVLTIVVCAIIVLCLLPSNYFGPISSRVRGLFVKHSKTGNPLVDSVAEHQPAKPNAYFQYLHQLCTFGPCGFVLVLMYFGDSPSFLSAFAIAAYYFSRKMVRLVLLMGPISSILGGITAGRVLIWSCSQLINLVDVEENQPQPKEIKTDKIDKKNKLKKGKEEIKEAKYEVKPSRVENIISTYIGNWVLVVTSLILLLTLYFSASAFSAFSWSIAPHLSHPSIIQKGRVRSGEVVYVDDVREAYNWIRKNTPEDARIMAWWDYGYQISAIANRTTIADGNTWNHEHIALLGKIFTTNVDEAYSIARHLADYFLVWAGGGGDDLAKSPHLARIANSVYRDLCPGDPVCSSFGLVRPQKGQENLMLQNGMIPSSQMQASLVHHLVRDGVSPGVKVDPEKFQEVFSSKFGKVRVFKIVGADQESKEWAADPKNRICDAPGSWFCRGQYPPALKEVLDKGKTFVQLEDFNKKEDDTEYQRLYMENLAKQREKNKHNRRKEGARTDL